MQTLCRCYFGESASNEVSVAIKKGIKSLSEMPAYHISQPSLAISGFICLSTWPEDLSLYSSILMLHFVKSKLESTSSKQLAAGSGSFLGFSFAIFQLGWPCFDKVFLNLVEQLFGADCQIFEVVFRTELWECLFVPVVIQTISRLLHENKITVCLQSDKNSRNELSKDQCEAHFHQCLDEGSSNSVNVRYKHLVDAILLHLDSFL